MIDDVIKEGRRAYLARYLTSFISNDLTEKNAAIHKRRLAQLESNLHILFPDQNTLVPDAEVAPAATGLRWQQSIVTVASDPSLNDSDRTWIKTCWDAFEKWMEQNTSLLFQWTNNYAAANMPITISEIDGNGKTLAQTEIQYQPSLDKIVRALVRFDRADEHRANKHETGLHEFFHGVGLAHQEDDEHGLLFPAKNNATGPGEYELRESQARYPKQKRGS